MGLGKQAKTLSKLQHEAPEEKPAHLSFVGQGRLEGQGSRPIDLAHDQ